MRNTNQYFVQLPNNLAEKYDNKILLVLALILRRKQLDGVCILQLEDIYNKLGLKPKHKYRALIRNLLVKAQNDGVIVCKEDLSRINSTKLVEVEIPVEDNFTQIPYEVIDAIIEYDGSESKYNIFAVYYAIKKHLFTTQTTWTIPYDRIKQITGIKSDKTIQNLVGILENMGLITKTLDNTTKTNNNHQRPCYSFSVVSQKEKNTIEPPRQQQPPRQQSTAENNNPSFSVVSKKEKEKKSSFSNKETTTAKEGRVLVENDKNISPPTQPTMMQTPPQTTTPTLQTIQEQQLTTRPKDISQKVWEAWMELPEVLRHGKSLEYCEEDGKYYVIQTLNGVKTRYLFAVQDDKYDDDDDLPL